MFKSLVGSRARLAIDLETIRDTLLYMESDIRHGDGMEKIAAGLRTTLREIEAFERNEQAGRHTPGTATVPSLTPSFVPLTDSPDV